MQQDKLNEDVKFQSEKVAEIKSKMEAITKDQKEKIGELEV